MKLNELIETGPQDSVEILESFVITTAKMQRYNNIMCSISGGSDSDIMLDLCQKIDGAEKITYVFFDTGLELQATKDHIRFLEDKYGIEIKIIKAIKPIPICCKEYGQPFLSKQVSEWIARLQKHNFRWEDESFDVLYARYPKCKSALRWWCNDFPNENNRISRFNIDYNQYLKDFLINNPPTFKISNKCCTYAKKKVAAAYKKENDYDLNMYGVRKTEGGARNSAYKNCFTEHESDVDEYRPIFWYKSATKRIYEEFYEIEHSRCYTEYGLKRTGCAGCPFGRDFETELEVMERFEPKLYIAVNNIFKDSYEYTRKYKRFVKEKKEQCAR